jgi:hypothetical protein
MFVMTQHPSDEPESIKYQRAQEQQWIRGILDNMERLRIELAQIVYAQTGALPKGLRPPRKRRTKKARLGQNVVHCAHLFRPTIRRDIDP